MSTDENIEQFCSYFRRQLEVISQLDVDWNSLPGSAIEDYQVRFYRKTLLVVGLDTLAGIRFPKSKYPVLARQNRERFTRFVKEFACWFDGDRVSLPFLKDNLSQRHLVQGTLGSHVTNKLSQFSVEAGGHLEVSQIDEPSEPLLNLAQAEQEEEAIVECQHYSLLYRYRNYLVHQSREPGTSMEVNSLHSEPYYHGYVDDPRW